MENYPVLFPSSSRAEQQPSSPFSSSQNNMESSCILNSYTNFSKSSSINGMVGMKSERQSVFPRDDHQREANVVSEDPGGGGSEATTIPSEKKKAGKKIRKPRFAFQTRSQVDILDDGYRWRKYGQKAVKNNKFPRSYYRCTHQSCNVKKQVQRLSKDEGVVVTTYEGMHTHPIERSTDNFEHILNQMQIYTPF